MKVQTSLTRIRTQLSAMERMYRSMRAEVESLISAYAPGDIDNEVDVETGIGMALSAGKPLPPVSIQPYQHFFPGVWMGLDEEVGNCGATVTLKALQPHDPTNMVARVSRLSVNPVYPLVEKPRWMSLECTVDLQALRQAKALRIDLVSFFEISPANAATIPRTVGLTLRLHRNDGAVSDHPIYRLPVSTMPSAHSAPFNASNLQDAKLDTAHEARLLIDLPLAGDFMFHLDYLTVTATKS